MPIAIPESVAAIVVIAVCVLLLWLLLNMASGIVLLFVFNFIGGFFGFSLGVNAVTALVAGVLGIPGVILLVLVQNFL